MANNIDNADLKEKGLIAFFRSEYFVLLTFVSLITPLMAHTAYLLLQVSNIQNTWYSYFFAFSFDLAIFAFSINGRRSQATGLAFIVFILNVCFFNLTSLGSFFGNDQIVRLFVTVIISGAGSWIIHSYVVFFNEKIGEKREITKWITRNSEKDRAIHSLEAKLVDINTENRYLKVEIERLTAKTKIDFVEPIDVLNSLENGEITLPYTCKTCDQTVLTQKSLEGLVKYCKNSNCRFKTKVGVDIEELAVANHQ